MLFPRYVAPLTEIITSPGVNYTQYADEEFNSILHLTTLRRYIHVAQVTGSKRCNTGC